MKKILVFIPFLLLMLSACQTDTAGFNISEIKEGKVISTEGKSISIKGYNDAEATTFFMLRHAEKTESMDDPELTEEGNIRAERLAKILKDVPLSLATSTNYNRTTQTANPTVFEKKCDISVYAHHNMLEHFESILAERKGKKVLVIGHSNTIPELLNLFVGKEVYTNIPETEYSRFYIVSVKEMGDANVMEFEY